MASAASALRGIFSADELEVAQAEAAKLRREFSVSMAKVLEDPFYYVDSATDFVVDAEEEEDKRPQQRVSGGLVKTSVRAAKGGRVPKYGDEVSCAVEVVGGGLRAFRSSACKFVVGALRVPGVLSACAVATALGEVADFQDGDQRVRLELVAIRSPERPLVEDVSGQLGAGNILVRRLKKHSDGASRCDVVYERTVYAVDTSDDKTTWPPEEDPDETRSTPAEAAAAVGLSVEALSAATVIEQTHTRLSRCALGLRLAATFSACGENNYVERLAVEAMGEEAMFYLSAKAAFAFCGAKGPVLATCRRLERVEYEDLQNNGGVVKRVRRRGEGLRPPRPGRDIVSVRGLVRLAQDDSVACALGADVVGDPSEEAWTRAPCATWTLDQDGAGFSSTMLDAPLCEGIEIAASSMVEGEVAEFYVAAEYGFARRPSSPPPATARPTDVVAYHYAASDAAYQLLPAAAFSKPLVARLELVAKRPALDSLAVLANPAAQQQNNATTTTRAALDDARLLKDRAALHFHAKAFDRAARRYSDALVAVAVGLQANAALKLRVDEEEDPSDDIEARLVDLEATLRLNRAACDLKRCRHDRCLADCEAVLKKRPRDLKATYRAGLACLSLRDLDRARAFFDACLVVDESCVHARNGLKSLDEIQQRGHHHDGDFFFFGNSLRRRSRAAANADNHQRPLAEHARLEREYLKDLDDGKPPWMRAHATGNPGEEKEDDLNPRSLKRRPETLLR